MSLILFCDVQQLLQDCSALEVKAVNFYLVKKKNKNALNLPLQALQNWSFLRPEAKSFLFTISKVHVRFLIHYKHNTYFETQLNALLNLLPQQLYGMRGRV